MHQNKPKGFSFISLARKCRESVEVKVSAVDVGLVEVTAIELKHLYDAVTDPNEIYQQETIVISCACEALEAMTKRYQRGQNRSTGQLQCLDTLSNILNLKGQSNTKPKELALMFLMKSSYMYWSVSAVYATVTR